MGDASGVPRAARVASSLRRARIGIIGAGTMGQALLQGLLARGVSRTRLIAAEPDVRRRQQAARRFGIRVVAGNRAAAAASDVVILAVKPQQMAQALEELRGALRRHVVISIAAGVTLRWLQARLPGVAVIRVMPNLPATIACAFSAIAPGTRARRRHLAAARAIFEAIGEVVELPERYFDAVTAVSGSGPAYVFFLAQAWEDAARALGLPSTVARRAVRRTLGGSVRVLERDGHSPQELIARVASKRGTTEAALRVLARQRVAARFAQALRAAARRSAQLAWS
jgi:pyrroline-5-carboxylate reductase